GEILRQVMPEDLLKYGLIPEFIGRLPIVVALDALDEKALVRILKEPRNALVKQYKKFFDMDDVELIFDDDALDAIAKQAMARKTGARGLRTILEDIMLDVMYEIPSQEDIVKCLVSRDVVEKKVSPGLIRREHLTEETA
ncbi:MAG: ATP-dependent Clp protease ATP-binding subunit ClpX, partial [Firmicutes bacterium]|nr:ATP-dependent Clp protease ATP-binding subunit ClpX [Bacillota bacterium]